MFSRIIRIGWLLFLEKIGSCVFRSFGSPALSFVRLLVSRTCTLSQSRIVVRGVRWPLTIVYPCLCIEEKEPTWRTSLRMLLEKPPRFELLVVGDWVDSCVVMSSCCWWSLLLNCLAALSWRRFSSSHQMFTLNGDKCKSVLNACSWCLPSEDTMFDWLHAPIYHVIHPPNLQWRI